jgi:hypothetical protein
MSYSPARWGIQLWKVAAIVAATMLMLTSGRSVLGQEADQAPADKAPADKAPAAKEPSDQPMESSAESPQPKARVSGALPWEEPPRTSEPVLRPPAGPVEILERYDVGPSQLAGFFSGQPLGPSEEDVLIKILYLFPRFGLDNVERWRKSGITWDQLAAAPGEHRAEIFPIRGRVKRVEKQPVLPELVEFFEFDHYFRVTMAIDDSPYQALICTRHIPSAWKLDAELDERATADGLFLKVGDPGAEHPQFIFAAGRVAWLPDRVDLDQQIDKPQIALANVGMDIGLFDDVRASKTLPLGDTDREAFYQLLHALGKPAAKELRGAGPEPLDPVPLLQAPEKHHGEILRVRGRVQRVMRVPVEDVDIQRRFGLDHYYEIDLFVPLGETSLRLGKDPSGEKNPVYGNTFPATLIVREIPPDLQEGERVREMVRADGVFFKVWTYRSQYTDKFKQLQPALMFLASEPTVIRTEPQTNTVVSVLVSAAFVLAVGTVLIVWWWFGRSDRAALAAARSAEVLPPPDFSKLAD